MVSLRIWFLTFLHTPPTHSIYACASRKQGRFTCETSQSLQVHPSSTALLTPRFFMPGCQAFLNLVLLPEAISVDCTMTSWSLRQFPQLPSWSQSLSSLKLSDTKWSSWVTTTPWWLWLYICMILHRFYPGLGFTAVFNESMGIRALCVHTGLIVSVPSSIKGSAPC